MPTVLLTGAASGIGRAAAHHFAAQGWHCLLVDRDGDGLEQVLRDLPGTHEARRTDLTDPAQVGSLGATGRLSGPIDAIVNNAGMSDSRGDPLAQQPPERQAALARLNLAAPAAVVTAVDARLVPGARIVNVSSGAGLRAIPFRGYYSATKAGLVAQSKALAAARPELIVTVLCPGFVRTELVDGLIAAGRLDPRQAVAKTPMGRMGEPAELAEMIGFLASPGAAAISGQVVSLCGGSSVYGGSRACEPATRAMRPMSTPSRVIVEGAEPDRWRHLVGDSGAAGDGDASGAYPAEVDATALAIAGDGGNADGVPGIVAAVHQAARRFASRHAADASLTVLLPVEGADAVPWHRAGDAAAARMLVATLACELAPRALRVNAIEVAPGLAPDQLRPLLHYVAGARAQFLTGQTLRTHRA
jgi:NAD(P)-dependent dehydrogenase (short-subunit alcohol dehydrogenase family)